VCPSEVIESLTAYGATALATRSGQPEDSRFGWSFVGPVVNVLRGPDQNLAIQELYEAGVSSEDPLRLVGAYNLLKEWEPTSKDERFLELEDRFLDFMHERRYSSGHLTRYEADRWIAVHGDLRTSFDRIVETEVPSFSDAPTAGELELGTAKLLLLTAPLPEGNAFYAERHLDGSYAVFSERQYSNEDPTRSRYEEDELGPFSSMAELLRTLGEWFGLRPYWADPDIEPYFTSYRG